MSQRLKLVREEKLFRLLPGRDESSRLEASGIALVDDTTALVVFDNLNRVARIDLSLKPRKTNRLIPAPSLGLGFEDIAIDNERGNVFCLIEALEDVDGSMRGFVAEYDANSRFMRCTRLGTRLQEANKGFEGLAHIRHGGRELLYALSEGNRKTGKRDGGVDVFLRVAGRRVEILAPDSPVEGGRPRGLRSARLPLRAGCHRLAGLGAVVGRPDR